MANLKSSKKDVRRNTRLRGINLSVRTGLKTSVKKARQAITEGDAAKATQAVREVQKQLDKAVKRGIIHKRQAARRKSRIASQAAKLGS